MQYRAALFLGLLVGMFALSLPAAVTRIEVTERADLPVSNYERITGKIHFAVDPKLPANRKIVDIDLAPKNAKGHVEFSADLLVYRPKDPAKSNGTAFVEIPNRGGVGLIQGLHVNGVGRGLSAADFGDRFLFDQGFTLVWVGWQWDVPQTGWVLKLYPPVAKGITGPVRAEIIVDRKSTSESLADRTMIPYTVADRWTATLTVRDRPGAPRTEIPRANWKFSADGTKAEYPAGFEPGKLYEVIYTATDPPITGLGFASVRDYVAYIKQHGIVQRGDIKRVMTLGNSQSGRFLRTFLADGFNSDEKRKRVFDGVWVHIAGAGRGDFNQRFAQQSRSTGQHNGVDYPTDLAPFLPAALVADYSTATKPKVMITNGSHEYWGRAASLNHTTSDGQQDTLPPMDMRIYLLAGTQHGTAATITDNGGALQNLTNPMEWRWFRRAMTVAVNSWISGDAAPPESQVPWIASGELVPPRALKFPRLPHVSVAKEAYSPARLDFGPEFATKGIIAFEPPKIIEPYVALVPQVDADGNETSGVRMPELAVPLATYMGWNLRGAKIGAPHAQYPLIGSMVPFEKTRAEREFSNDPRLSIEERYKSREEYLAKIDTVARRLVQQGFVLERDVPLIVDQARQRWAWVQGK